MSENPSPLPEELNQEEVEAIIKALLHQAKNGSHRKDGLWDREIWNNYVARSLASLVRLKASEKQLQAFQQAVDASTKLVRFFN